MLHFTQQLNKLIISLSLVLLSTSAHALKDDTEKPLNITSVEQLADFESNKAIFIGNVIAIQGTIEVHADKAEILRDSQGKLEAIHAWGKPATYKQLQDNGKIIHSQSSVIEYYPKEDNVILIGRATIWQENSHVDGERIVYNLNTKQLKATNENSQGGRVKSTFIPQELQGDGSKKDNNTKTDDKKE